MGGISVSVRWLGDGGTSEFADEAFEFGDSVSEAGGFVHGGVVSAERGRSAWSG